MNQDTVVNLATQAISLSLKIAGPLLLVALVVGLLVSVFQAVTQIQEQTLSFVPKIVGMAVVAPACPAGAAEAAAPPLAPPLPRMCIPSASLSLTGTSP